MNTFDSHLEGKRVDSFMGSEDCKDCGNIVDMNGVYLLLETDVQKAKQEALKVILANKVCIIERDHKIEECVWVVKEDAIYKAFGRME